ncbi:MAG: sortase [Candidatus Dormibacteria bacterium]
MSLPRLPLTHAGGVLLALFAMLANGSLIAATPVSAEPSRTDPATWLASFWAHQQREPGPAGHFLDGLAIPPSSGPTDTLRSGTTRTGAPPDQPLMGYVSISRLNLVRVPLVDRGLNSSDQMLIAPGFAITHYIYSAPIGGNGNAVIFGHDDIEGSVFHYLDRLTTGDQVVIENTAGKTFTYQVQGARVAAPTDFSVLSPGDGAQLTLFTCYPYEVDSKRLVITARLVS